jgi:hypothetical protein
MMVKRGAILHPFFLGLVLAVGAGAVWAFAVGWCLMVTTEVWHVDYVRESVTFMLDGTPLIQSYAGADWTTRSYRTLDGQPVAPEESPDRLGALWGCQLQGPELPRARLWLIPWRDRIRGTSDGGRPAQYWYFVHDGQLDGAGYFVGYDPQTKMSIGSIGRQGFRPGPLPPEERFAINGRRAGAYGRYEGVIRIEDSYPSGQEPRYYGYGYAEVPPGVIPDWVVHLIAGNELLEIDLRARSVRVVLESEGLISVDTVRRALAELPSEEDDSRRRLAIDLAVRLEDRVLIFDAQGEQHASFRLPDELRGHDFALYELSDATAIIRVDGPIGRPSRETHLTWIDQAGKVLRHEEVELQSSRHPLNSRAVQPWLTALAVPSPVAMAVEATVIWPLRHRREAEGGEYSAALARSLAEWWAPLLATCVVGAVLAWVCGRRQRQHGVAWSAVWIAFVFLGGVPGFLAYLFHRRWPVRLACPQCGEEAPRDRESCFACDTEFPEPEPKGIEVFA